MPASRSREGVVDLGTLPGDLRSGAVLTLGLVQRWGEVFPRWMIGLAGCRVPIALAVVPASLVSVLLVVGGVVIWSGLDQMVARLVAVGLRVWDSSGK